MSCEQTTPVSVGSRRNLVQRRSRIRALSCQLVDTCLFCWRERQGRRMEDGEIVRRNFDKKIRRDSRFLSRAVTRRNAMEMDRWAHSKCHCNAGITLTEVSRSFVPPPSSVYLRSRERRTHATQQLFYIRQDSSTSGKHAKSLLGNPMWQRNRSHRRLSCTWHEREAITF